MSVDKLHIVSWSGGCWFCPNQPISELAQLKQTEPDKWRELEILSKEPNTIARSFKYGKTFPQVTVEVDAFIANPPNLII